MSYRRQLVYSLLTLIVTVFTVSVLTSISRLSSLQNQLTVTPPAEGFWAVSQAEFELLRLLEALKVGPSTQSGLNRASRKTVRHILESRGHFGGRRSWEVG
ncbi:MAG: hypothetical protein HC808_08660 [Candidatus Competibacteraceae bacterium]|nr:hypothetical protein [Candidatus Competibacteraceae bacterium]